MHHSNTGGGGISSNNNQNGPYQNNYLSAVQNQNMQNMSKQDQLLNVGLLSGQREGTKKRVSNDDFEKALLSSGAHSGVVSRTNLNS